jgi:hypothetical protein
MKTRRLYAPLKHCLLLLFFLVTLTLVHAQKPWLHVDGNQIKDPAGNPVTLRGVSVLPSEHQNECTTCNNKPLSEMIAWQADASRGWYSRVLRLPVTTAKVKDPATSFATHIDPFVQQAIALNQYVIVDLHLVSNYDVNGSGGVKQQFVLDFWNYVAPRYANTPNVIFEVFNEPVNPDNWTSWKNYIQPVINAIRAVAPNNLILVGSPQWSTRVNNAVTDPILGSNLVYVYHIYPNQGAATATNLNAKFGNAANTIPVMLTEFGWNQDPNYSDGVTYGTTGGWGTPFRNYIDAHPWISWQGWIFDNFWKPQYFDWNWNLMAGENQGKFMQNWFFDMQNHNQPGGSGGTGTQTPFVAQTIPGKIQAEDFDNGNQDVAYHDTDLGNNGSTYRTSDVDIGTTTDVGGGHTVGYIVNGEWLEYTLSNVTSGTYTISFRTAGTSTQAGKSITAKLDGVTLGTVSPTNTGGWETWETLTLSGINITGGANKVLRLEFGVGGFNLNHVEFTASGSTTSTVVVNQQQNGNVWNPVGTFPFSAGSSGSVKIRTDATNGYVISDAVKFSRSGQPDIILDSENTAGINTSGSWTASTSNAGYIGSNYKHDGNTGKGSKSVTYTPTLPVAGDWTVSVIWTAGTNRASNVPIDIVHAAPIVDTTPPAAPAGLTAVASGSSQINLNWNDNTEPDLSHYIVKRSTVAGGPYTQVATGLNSSIYSDTGISGSTTYYYIVTAVDFTGNQSGISNEASASTGTATSYEAENTSRWSNGATNSVTSNAAASAGNFVRLTSDGTGDFIEYTIPHTGTANYILSLGFRAGPDQGTCQLYKDGAPIGSAIDLYSATTEFKEVQIGSLTFYTGDQKIRFTVSGKNASSSGYQLTQDYIKLSTTTGARIPATTPYDKVTDAAIQVYPNPANVSLMLNGLAANSKITIHDRMGHVWMTLDSQDRSISIDIQKLKPGLHIIRIESGTQVYSTSFQKE